MYDAGYALFCACILPKACTYVIGTGVRAPYLRVGGNKQFEMMADQFFVYDTSITAPLNRVPMWPYTLYYRYETYFSINYFTKNCSVFYIKFVVLL